MTQLNIYVLSAMGLDDLYLYRGYSRERVSEQRDEVAIGFLAANLGPVGTWLNPDRYADTRAGMIRAVGADRFHEMWRKPNLPRSCLICGYDLTGVMGCSVFVHDKHPARNQRSIGRYIQVPGEPLMCTGCYRDRGGNLFGLAEYHRLTS